ncbi:MAG: LPS export ABC transporter periplasmic protein LptC [Bacteroidota bacterium]
MKKTDLIPKVLVYCLLLMPMISSCGGEKSILKMPKYEGPTMVMDSIVTRFSDEGFVKFILKAPREEKYESGNQIWPSGMLLEIYDEETKNLTTTFEADSVFYDRLTNLYRGEGNVVVLNHRTREQLNTEELFWDRNEEQFYTDQFVTIKDEDGLPTYGEGLTANQDFSEYTILRAVGEKEMGQNFQ